MKRTVSRLGLFMGLLMAALLVCGFTVSASEGTKVVVRENGKMDTYFVEETDKDVIYDDFYRELKLCQYDDVSMKKRGEAYVISIKRAYDVKIHVGKKTYTVKILNENVATALERAGLTLGEEDILSKPLKEKLKEGDEVTLQRVTYRVTETVTEIPFTEEYLRTPCLADGKTVLLIEGKNGATTHRVTDRMIDDTVDTTTVEDLVTTQPVTAIYLVGDSSLGFDETQLPSFLTLNSRGEPTEYLYKVTGKGTAYYAAPGAITATGATAMVGRVAVDPAEIPYGSLLYITSADGKFVYGFAVACDTGSALYAGNVVVDLYFETYDECCNFGARKVKIYVLA